MVSTQNSVWDQPHTLNIFLTSHRHHLSSSTCDTCHQTLVSFIFLESFSKRGSNNSYKVF